MLPSLLCLLALFTLQATSTRVLIIGAGIGGGSTAFFAQNFTRQLGKPDLEIHVLETRGYVGGRLKHMVVDGAVLEMGGDAWSSVNQYVASTAAFLKVPVVGGGSSSDSSSSSSQPDPYASTKQPIASRYPPSAIGDLKRLMDQPQLGVWNGYNFINITDLMNSQAASVAATEGALFTFLGNLQTNYQLRDHSMPNNGSFDTIEEFLAPGGLSQYVNVSGSAFFDGLNVTPLFQSESIEPLQRTIYDQVLDETQAFASMVTLTSTVDAYSVATGNSMLVEAMFNYSNAQIQLNTTATSITPVNSGSGYTVAFTNASGAFALDADIVVLASPIEHAHLQFLNMPQPKVTPRLWVKWFVTLMGCGKGINPEYFSQSDPSVIAQTIFSTANSTTTTPFNSLSLQGLTSSGVPFYKIFSNADVSHLIDKICLDARWFFVEEWPYTFPILQPVPESTTDSNDSQFQPVKLASNLYYVNGIESLASAMECSTIAGRNIALHISQSSIELE